MTPEKLGEMVAAKFIRTPEFNEAVDELAYKVCDELLHDLAIKLRNKVEHDMGLAWGDSDEKHYDFAMSFEGDICRAARDAIAVAIKNY